MSDIGKVLIVIGIIIITVGLILTLGGNRFSWIGRLPGDIRIERENFKLFIPITTMLLLSLLLTLIMWLARKIF